MAGVTQNTAAVVTMRELEILEHLTYIIEAISEGVTSEAKFELGCLHKLVEEDTGLAADVRREALTRLGGAQEAIKQHSGDAHSGAGYLCGLSRFLWKRVLPSAPECRDPWGSEFLAWLKSLPPGGTFEIRVPGMEPITVESQPPKK